MKTILMVMLLQAVVLHAQVSPAFTVGVRQGDGSVGFGMLEDIFKRRLHLTQEFISMIPHVNNSTYWGGRIGVTIVSNISIEGGYYYREYSADKDEYTKGKSGTEVAGYICYSKAFYKVQLGYLHELQLLFTVRLNN